MHVFETFVRPGDEAKKFATAIHRFIERRASDSDFAVSVRSEPLGEQERKVLTLWSDTAVTEFAELWRDLRAD
ncbi:hypothetical protein BH11PSE2_BH11PSE2_09180 [soil metagenome]